MDRMYDPDGEWSEVIEDWEGWNPHHSFTELELDIFVELIIKECVSVIKRDMELADIQLVPLDFKMYANNRLNRVIKEQFGIEDEKY